MGHSTKNGGEPWADTKDAPVVRKDMGGQKGGYFDFYDNPNFRAEGKAEKFVADDFLICDGQVVYHIHWELHKDKDGKTSYKNIKGEKADKLPNYGKETLAKDGFAEGLSQ